MNSPAEAQRVSDTNIAVDLHQSDALRSGGGRRDQQGRSAEVLRLAAAALKAQPGADEAFAYYAAIYDKLSQHEEAFVAFGNLLAARANDVAAYSEALNRLNHLQHVSVTRLDQLVQMELLRAWSDELGTFRHADPKRLVRYGFKVYSQCDEDGIIQEIFKRIGTTNRVFVEFGVESGIECNSVKLLVEGWRGLWLDGSEQYFEQIITRFRTFMDNHQLAVTRDFITAENINELIGQGGVRGEIDLLSIDIDNNDYWVWKAIDVVQPRVVVIEYNATLHPPLSLVVPYDPKQTWQGSNYFGASLEALVRLGRSKGYRLVGCNCSGSNAFFVREDLTKDLFLDPPTAEEHYEPPRYYFYLLKAGHPGQPGPYLIV
jgi:tetratricopeptide (TPR) repeat protein